MVMIIRAKLVANQPLGLPFMTDVKQQVPVKSEFLNQTTRVTKKKRKKKVIHGTIFQKSKKKIKYELNKKN